MRAELGHLVLNVSNLEVSERFYCRVLGMKKRRGGKVNGRSMVFLTCGSKDHDIALLEVGASARARDEAQIGLRHVAFRIGDRVELLRAFKEHLDGLGISPRRTTEHRASWSVYLTDPDGIEIEVYVDSKTPIWQSDEEIDVTNPPLKLD